MVSGGQQWLDDSHNSLPNISFTMATNPCAT